MIRRLVYSRWTLVALALAGLSVAHLWAWGTFDLTRTISVVEAEWSLVAAIGVVYSIDFIGECVRDGRAAPIDDEATRETVDMFILIGAVLAGLHGILLTFGLTTMGAPTGPAARSPGFRALAIVLTVFGELAVLTLAVIRSKRARVRELAESASDQPLPR